MPGQSEQVVQRMVDGVPAIKAYLETLTEDREMDTQLTLGEVDEQDDGSIIIMI